MRYVALARVSTGNQRDNLSKGVQFKSIDDYATGQGWTCVAEYFDNESRTSFDERDGLQTALKQIDKGEADVAIYYDVSRMGIDESINKFIEALYAVGGKLAVATERRLFQNKTEAIEATFWNKAVSTYEFIQIKKRTFNGKRRAIELGGWCWKPPFGYKTVPYKTDNGEKIKVLAPDDVEVELVKEIYEALIAGEGRYELAGRLNRASSGHTFSYNLIKAVENNAERYIGGSEYKSFNLDGREVGNTYTYPRIISDELYYRLRKAQTVKPAKQTRKRVTPFKGLVRCFHHEEDAQNAGYNNGSTTLVCGTLKRRNYKRTQGQKEPEDYCRAGISHKRVREEVIEFLTSYDHSSYDAALSLLQTELEELERRESPIDTLKRQLEQTKEALFRVDAPLEDVAAAFNERLARLRKDIEQEEDTLLINQNLKELYRHILDRLRFHDDEAFYGRISDTITFMKEDDWEKANDALYELGVVVYVDFSTRPAQVVACVVDHKRLADRVEAGAGYRTVFNRLQEIQPSLSEKMKGIDLLLMSLQG
jgi:DNA invertase Pin-like site-specific DNA recombinase/FtsZ-binding cell division protein ZapB